MTKWTILLMATVLLLLEQQSNGQTIQNADTKRVNIRKDSGLYISINGGCSIPFGYFKSPTYLGYGGYAKNGYGGNIEIEHPLRPGWLGLAFEIGYYANPFNLSSYVNSLNPYYLSAFNYTYNSTTPYIEVPILAGVFFQKIFKKITFEFKSKVGVDFITPPNVNADQGLNYFPIIGPLGASNFVNSNSQPSTTFPVFAYSFETSIRYKLIKQVSIQGNIGYLNNFYSKPDLSYPSKYQRYNIPLSQLHLEIGLVFQILK